MPIPITAEQAAALVEPGSRVLVGEACGEPQTLVGALVSAREHLRGTRIVGGMVVEGCGYIGQGLEDFFEITTLQLSSLTRDLVRRGRARSLPVSRSQMSRLFQPGGPLPLDAALVQVAPPDSEGYCSLGVSVGCDLEAALAARRVIAEVNPTMPRTLGNSRLPLSRLDHIVETSRPLLSYRQARLGDTERQVGEMAARLIPDGATLQLGIGTIPEAILTCLYRKRDLGIHSGMATDAVVELMEQGVVTNARKTIDSGVTVTGLLLGSPRLYRFAHDNPRLGLYPVTYTHNARVIARIDNFVALNTAIEIDLWGQVNAETVDGMQLSNVGGQADFVRGAQMSPGGRSIIALTSTARGGKQSRIVPRLKTGNAVTTPRYDVQYVVTEYGITELWGKTLEERARALIAIAHPYFRGELAHALDRLEEGEQR